LEFGNGGGQGFPVKRGALTPSKRVNGVIEEFQFRVLILVYERDHSPSTAPVLKVSRRESGKRKKESLLSTGGDSRLSSSHGR